MYVVFLIILSVIASQGIGLSYKKGAERTVDPISSPPLMCTFAALFIATMFAIMAFAVDGGISFPNKMSFIFAAATGAAYAFAAFFYLVALSCGPYTISLILLNMSSFMPILYSWAFLGESMSATQIAGLTIVIISCILLTIARNRGAQASKVNTRWVIFAVFMFISNSLFSFSIRAHTKLVPEASSNSFFVATYIIAALFCLIFFLATGGLKKKIKPNPLIAPALGVAVSLSGTLVPMAELPKYLSAALQYPIEKGSSILLGVLVGVVFFKERINKLGYVCIAAIISALCLIGMA